MPAWGRVLLVLTILSGAGVAGGCATVVRGTSQTINIDSQPSGAQCTLTRDGQTVGSLVTPGQITVSRSRRAIKAICRKADYQDTGDFLAAERDSAVPAPGIPPLGLLVVANNMVDMASGAYAQYPASFKVWLVVPNGSSADPASMAPDLVAATGSFDGRYFGAFRSHAGFPNFDRIQIDVQVVAGRGTGTAKIDACAVPGEVSLAVDRFGAVVGRLQLMDGSCQGAVMTFAGQIKDGHMNLRIARNVEASLVKQP
jgi:hypothetical protein